MTILAYLRRILCKSPSLPELPQRQADIGDYRTHFEQAASFTRLCGFQVPDTNWVDYDVLSDDVAFVHEALIAAGVTDLSPSAGQCLKWCHYLQPYFEQALKVPVWLTIGQLWASNESVFAPSWDDLRRWTKSGINPVELAMEGRHGVNLHAWLTLATGEIIEPTLLSSIALFRPSDADRLRGGVTWGRDPGVVANHRYVPMAVGSKIAEAIGGHPQCPLLASHKEDLMVVPAIGVLYPIQ